MPGEGDEERCFVNEKKKSLWLKGVIVSAVLVVLPPLAGLAPTVIGMLRAFRTLSAGGVVSDTELSQDISTSLCATAAGIAVSSIAAIALIICVVGLVLERRKCRHG